MVGEVNNRKSGFMDVIDAVMIERQFQDEKHGNIEDFPHEKGTWLLLIEDELNEAKEGLIKGGIGRNSFRQELLQVAALCIATLEQHGLEEDGERL